jgi:alpha,alpha-trehalose phosphorylase
VIRQPGFSLEPWAIRETGLDLERLAQTESVFALSNGHLGWRGVLDEGEPHGLPGSYLNGVYELRPLPAGEPSYGRPESGQTVINVTNGKLIRLFVDDEPFDVRYGSLRSHERVLDFRTGVLTRQAEWESPVGAAVRVVSRRLVSFSHRAIAAICYDVEPLSQPVQISVQSELLANEQLPAPDGDPRATAVLDHPLVPEYQDQDESMKAVVMLHTTRHSGLRVAAAMGHSIEAPGSLDTTTRAHPDVGMVTAATVLKPGERLRLIKLVSYGWSGERSLEAVRDQVWAALAGAKQAGWDGLVAAQRAYLDDFWDRADVEVAGDAEIQQAVRFALFHVLQAAARGEDRPIPAKGLTGPGYDGHAFWDS